ncbi:hypothetical protein [Lentzea sp. NEAU-D7]|uniref:hypothetical protein n=1 Tax=Lentzea sp. NEAU-D7 TaxID=2994667 RepID=UPI00224B61AC|nr:hypothetical protein [Lentzea sp. NEAU-D7]MCX2947823.1 hypothetical protein [Lentzea sp. NEAU-D7]
MLRPHRPLVAALSVHGRTDSFRPEHAATELRRWSCRAGRHRDPESRRTAARVLAVLAASGGEASCADLVRDRPDVRAG